LLLAASATGTLCALLGAAVPSTRMVRAQAALAGLLGGAVLGAAVEYTSPVLSADNVTQAVERYRVRPGWTEDLYWRTKQLKPGSTTPMVDSVANAITNLSMLESGLDMYVPSPHLHSPNGTLPFASKERATTVSPGHLTSIAPRSLCRLCAR
jgi:hypothetical protein